MKKDGLIIKGIGGFYYVEAAEKIYECKARGIFRKDGVTPLAGDYVTVTVDLPGKENTIDSIKDRKNFLKRPPIANIDKLFVVISMLEPSPNYLVTDRLIAYAEHKNIEPIIIITKDDLASADEVERIYQNSGFKVIRASGETNENIDEVRNEINGHISAFAGNSGVGKSTLLNAADSSLKLKTGEISEKLGRGRHTTRQVELFKVCGGYVADTPGFSSLDSDFEKGEFISKDELQYCFREFLPYLGSCKFSTCAHVRDSGCKVLEHVEDGSIPKSRHESYTELYNEVKDVKDWQLK